MGYVPFSAVSLRGEKLNYKSVAKDISKPPFLAPEVQWASKFTVSVRFTFPLKCYYDQIFDIRFLTFPYTIGLS